MTQYEFVKDQIEYLGDKDLFELVEMYVEAYKHEPIYRMDLPLIFSLCKEDIEEFIRETFDNCSFDKNRKYFTFDGYGYIETFDDLLDYYGLDDLTKFALEERDMVDYLIEFQEEEEEEDE